MTRHEAFQSSEMRAAPVDVITLLALLERAKTAIDSRRHQIADVLSGDCDQIAVARHAARKRSKRASQVQRLDDLRQLLLWLSRAQPLTSHDGLALQKSHITREQRPLLSRRDRRQFRIVQPVAVTSIETKQTQEARECPEMHVCNEARRTQRLGSEPMEGRNVEPLELGIHRHALAAQQLAIESH